MMVASLRQGLLTGAILGLASCHAAPQPAGQPTSSATPAIAAAAAPTPTPTVQAPPPSQPLPEISASLTPAPSQPGDLAGSHDLAFLKRFQGATLIGYVAHTYDRISLYDSSGSTDPAHATPIEGAVTRLIYRVPVGHTALEVLRNYEDFAKGVGMLQTSEIDCASKFGGFGSVFFEQIGFGKLGNPYYVGGTAPDNEVPACYLTARATSGGHVLGLAVYVAEKHKYLTIPGSDGKPLVFQDGEVVVGVDVVLSKTVVDQMVTVKAADMADALASKGAIDLYGIYFDTDQTAVKPESAATLGEIASLLKIDRSLKIEVSGHTDNAGSADHNLKLSQGRAEAVVAALVGQYGIDRTRLVARGYGSTKPVASNADAAGMAKNRRVQLRKM